MKDKIVALTFDSYEQNTLIEALNENRNNLLAGGHPTDAVEELLLKIIDAPERNPRGKEKRCRNEAR